MTYTFQQGDTLWLIAQRFGISVDVLLALNPQITNPDLIYPGQVIRITSTPRKAANFAYLGRLQSGCN